VAIISLLNYVAILLFLLPLNYMAIADAQSHRFSENSHILACRFCGNSHVFVTNTLLFSKIPRQSLEYMDIVAIAELRGNFVAQYCH